MQDSAADGVDTAADATTGSPWLGLWLKPRRTFRGLLRQEPRLAEWTLVMVFATLAIISLSEITKLPPLLVLPFAILTGYLALPYLFIKARILALGGRLLGGTGTAADLRSALAWAHLPIVIGFALQLALSRELHVDLPIVGAIAILIAAVWYAVLTVLLVAEAHRFTLRRSFALMFAWVVLARLAIGLVKLATA